MEARGIRVAMFVHSFDDRAVSRLVLRLCRALAGVGCEVCIIAGTTERRGDPAPGVRLISLGLGRRRSAFGIPRLAACLRSLRPDVMFAHGNGPNRAAIAARLIARSPRCVIAVEHNHYPTFFAGRRSLRDRMTAFLYPRADRVAGVSPGVSADLAGRFRLDPSKTAFLPICVPEPAEMAELAQAVPDHPWFARPRDWRLICCVANLVPRKGQHVLVEAMPRIRAALGDVRLVLVGRPDDPGYVSRLQRRAADLGLDGSVWFAGYQESAIGFTAHSDLFALASVTEGCPTVIIEAMTLGVPVVSTDCPSGPSFLLDGGRCGVLVPMGDPPAFADAVASLLGDGERLQAMTAAARERGRMFEPSAAAAAYLDLAGGCGS